VVEHAPGLPEPVGHVAAYGQPGRSASGTASSRPASRTGSSSLNRRVRARPPTRTRYRPLATRVNEASSSQIAGVVKSLRRLELKKRPSVSETIDWAQTLVLLDAEEISTELVVGTLHVLLKHQSDIEKATAELQSAR